MKHYTVRELAERYAVSESTIYREIKEGNMESTQVRGSLRISEEAIEEYERSGNAGEGSPGSDGE